MELRIDVVNEILLSFLVSLVIDVLNFYVYIWRLFGYVFVGWLFFVGLFRGFFSFVLCVLLCCLLFFWVIFIIFARRVKVLRD